MDKIPPLILTPFNLEVSVLIKQYIRRLTNSVVTTFQFIRFFVYYKQKVTVH